LRVIESSNFSGFPLSLLKAYREETGKDRTPLDLFETLSKRSGRKQSI